MANLSLQKYETEIEGLELVIDQATGDVYASQSATARMCDCNERTIRRFVTSAQIEVKTAEIITGSGLKTSALLGENAILQALAKYNPALLAQCAKAGLRVYLYGLAGYQAKAIDLVVPRTLAQALRLAADQAEALELQQKQIAALEEHTLAQAEIIDELFDYSSIIRVAKYNGCDEKAFSWHRLKAAAKTIGEEIKKAPCPRYGEKNLYSHSTWRLAYPEYRLPETTTIRLR